MAYKFDYIGPKIYIGNNGECFIHRAYQNLSKKNMPSNKIPSKRNISQKSNRK